MIELSKINGKEILEFLNYKERNDDFEDIYLNGYYFEDQEIKDGKYELTFMSEYDNWGTYQEIPGNCIRIYESGKVSLALQEPFEGIVFEKVIEEVLEGWLKDHTFKENMEDEFLVLINSAKEKILSVESFGDKERIKELIKILQESLTFIK